MKKFLLFMLGVLIALPGVARDFSYTYKGKTLYYTVLDEEAKTCMTKKGTYDRGGNNPGSGELVIPAVAKDGDVEYAVTTIGEYAFAGCRGLTSVTIPNSVTEIDNDAFLFCSGLKTVTVEDGQSLITIALGALACDVIEYLYIGRNWSYSEVNDFTISMRVTSVEIGNSVTELPDYAFTYNTYLTSVTIPNSVTSIGEKAFRGCSALTSVTIPNSVTEIGSYAFSGSSGLTSVNIPTSVTSISSYAFSDCSGLTSVNIPNSVTEIGSYAFSGCSGLTSVNIPNSVTSISSYAFSGCSGLTSVNIPNSVTSISSYAFSGCSGLTWVVIPNSVTNIGENTFYDCRKLKKSAYPSGLSNPFTTLSYGAIIIKYPGEGAIIEDGFIYGPEKNVIFFAPLSIEGEYVIPESVTSIGEKAFYECSAMTLVKATAVNPPAMNDNSFQGLYATAALSVPEDAVNNYLATNWSLFENLRIGDSEATCQTYETGNLKYLLIPAKTEEDNNLAVVIPGDYSSLTEVTIPERFTVNEDGKTDRYFVDAIGYKAFNGCSNLATVTFNSRNTAKTIGEYAFAETKISTITLPETIESIGNYAFSNCASLSNIEIPGSVRTIGDYAFYETIALKEMTFNEGLESIGNYAFSNCASLSNIEIPGSVRTIGDYAFYETIALKEMTFNEGLESIGKYAFALSVGKFYGPIYIPSTLKKVGESAFAIRRCLGVDISDLAAWCDIDFENSSSNPATNAYKCTYLSLNGKTITDLVIPESVVSIKDYAFRDSRIKTVKFHDALRSIGASAFNNCTNLTKVVIPGSVTSIGEDAFYDSNVRDLTFEYSAAAIELASWAFPRPEILSWDRPIDNMNLSNGRLTSLTLGNSVTEIPASLFKGAMQLTALNIGNSVTAIGDEAFSECTSLPEVILPPSVETIGASAFAGNTKLTSIIMGHNVTTIGEKAYDLCPAQTVSITAQTPPTAPDNTFSNYTGSLYVQGENAVKAYYDADFCWYQFEGHVMIEPADLKVEGDKTLTGKPGDTFQLTATLYPADVTLPQIFWRSTNPDIATVDANGLVTLHAAMSEVMAMAEGDDDSATSCKIIAESLYANGPVAEITVNNSSSGIDEIVTDPEVSEEIDFTAPVEVYNLQGVIVARTTDNLATGFYIVRQGKNVKKIAVK